MIGLNYIRNLYKKTTVDLAKELGITNGLISQWEQEKKPIPDKRVKQLSKLFGIPDVYFTKQVSDIDKLLIENIKIDQDISKTEYEYEDTVYDEKINDYITIPQIGYDNSLIELKEINDSTIKKLKVLQKIDGIISSSQDAESLSDVIDTMDSYSLIFDRFADIVQDNSENTSGFLHYIMRAIELTCSLKTQRKIFGKGRPSSGAIEDENEFVQSLYKVMNDWKMKRNRTAKQIAALTRETENDDLF